jgi:uncharacterized protein (TIGR03437 family)
MIDLWRRFITRVCLLALLLMAAAPKEALGQTVDWVRRIGTLGLDEALGVAADSSGVYVAGYADGELPDLDKVGGQDAYLRKYDLTGNVLWTRQFGSVFEDQARGVAVDATGVYVVGTIGASLTDRTESNRYDAFIRKYDASGNLLWTRQIASIATLQNDYATAVAVDTTGVYVAGYTAGTLPGQSPVGSYDAFVRKYDSSGTELWTRQFGVKTQDIAVGVATNASGVFLLGETDAALPDQTFAGGVFDVFLRKYDSGGNEQWTRQFGTSGFDFPGGVAADAGGVYIAGATAGTLPGQTSGAGYDAFVRKYDNSGAEVWTRQFGATGDALAYGVAATTTGIYVAGNVIGTLPGQLGSGGSNEDVFARKYDTQGNVLWTRQFGTAERDWTNAVAASTSGVFVAGDSPRTLLSPTTTGDLDGVVTKLIEVPPVIPTLNSGGVVNAASLVAQAPLAAGSMASAFGTNLLPITQDRVLVQLNGITAPIYAITPTQINFQVPWELVGLTQATMTVTVGTTTSSPATVPLAAVAPGLFSTNASGSGQGAILIANTSFLAAPVGAFGGSRPASRGETISIYCTGLGAVSSQPPSGIPGAASPLSSTAVRPTVTIGGVSATVGFSGLAPGYVGLYQVNVQVPSTTPLGTAITVQLSIGGAISNIVTIAVQ